MTFQRKVKHLTFAVITVFLIGIGLFLWFLQQDVSSSKPLKISSVQVVDTKESGQITLRVRGQNLDDSRFNLLPDFANLRAIKKRIHGLGKLWDMAVSDNVLFVVSEREGLQAYAIDQPEPVLLGVVSLPGHARSLALTDKVAYVGCSDGGLVALDIHDPSNISLFSQTTGDFKVSAVAVSGHRLVAYLDRIGVGLFSIDNPAQPRLLSVFPFTDYISSMLFEGENVFLGTYSHGLHWLRLNGDDALVSIDSNHQTDDIRGLALTEDSLLAASRMHGVLDFPLTGGEKFLPPRLLEVPGRLGEISFKDGLLAVRGAYGGIGFFHYHPDGPLEELSTVAYAPTFGKVLLYGNQALSLDSRAVEVIDPHIPSPYQSRLVLSDNPTVSRIGGIVLHDQHLFFPCGSKGLAFSSLADSNHESLYRGHIFQVHWITPRLGLKEEPLPPNQESFDIARNVKGFIHNGTTGFLEVYGVGNIKVDISDPLHPKLDQDVIYPGTFSAMGRDSLVSSRGRTLMTFPLDPSKKLQSGQLEMPFGIRGRLVSDDLVFVWDSSSRLEVCSFSDPAAPVRLGGTRLAGVPMAALAKDGWLWFSIRGKGLQLVDVRTPASPKVMGLFRRFDQFHDLQVDEGHHLLGVSENALSVLDISSPLNPQLSQYLPLASIGVTLTCEGRRLFVSDANHGLQVFERQESGIYTYLGSTFIDPLVRDLQFNHGYGLLTNRDGQLLVYDFSDWRHPKKISEVNFEQNCFDVLFREKRMITAIDGGLQVWHQDGEQWAPTGVSLQLDSNPKMLVQNDDYVLAALGAEGLAIINAKDPDHLQLLSKIGLNGVVRQVESTGTLALLAMERNGLQVVDISDPQKPQIRGRIKPEWPMAKDCSVYDVEASGRVAYLASGSGGLWVVDLKDPDHPKTLKTIPLDGYCLGLKRKGDVLAVRANKTGIYLFDIGDRRDPVVTATIDLPQVSKMVFREDSLLACLNWGALIDIPLPQAPLKKRTGGDPDEMLLTFAWPYHNNVGILQGLGDRQNVQNGYFDLPSASSVSEVKRSE